MPSNTIPQMAICPNDENLAAFEAGLLPSEQSQAIAEHVSDCPSCEANLRALHVNRTLVACLRHGSEKRRFLSESACYELEQLACSIAGEQVPATVVDGVTPPPEVMLPLLPMVFGAYRLLERLGRGGMGIVYKAEQELLKRLVALKMVRAGVHATEEERTRFHREGHAIARVHNEHVVQIHEFGQHAGQLFFVMELLEGGTLADKLKGGSLPPREAAELARALARGVQAAHEQGIVHRDLKPSNVLFAADGTAKITDFGLAKLFGDQDSDTRTDAILGTPSYMSPEQANGAARTLGPATDVYSLGAILYETLTDRPPFRGETHLQTVEMVRNREPTPPSRRRPGLSRDLEAICLKCLEKEPSRRYSSAAALADDLGQWLRGEPTQARPPGRLQRAWRAVRRRPRMAAAVVLLAVLVLTATLASHRSDPERPLRNLEARLDRGESVVLIGAKGKPAWHSFAAGGGAAKVSEGNDGTFTVHTWSFALVELLRDPRRQSYRLRAEVQHQKGTPSLGVGIYVGDRQFTTTSGKVHSFVCWTFDEVRDLRAESVLLREKGKLAPRQPLPKGNRIDLSSRTFLVAEPDFKWSSSISHASDYFDRAPMSWRRIALEVTPRTLRAFWEGKPIGETTLDDLTRIRQESMDHYHEKHPGNPFVGLDVAPFVLRGGVGLFVDDGSAAFRNVVLEPLDENE